MNKKKIITAIALSILLCNSCIEDVLRESDIEPKMCLNCILSQQESRQTAYLSYSSLPYSPLYYQQITYDEVENAEIVLYAGEEEVGRFSRVKGVQNKYALEYTPVVGQEYTIKVFVAGEECLSSTTKMPEKVPVEWKGNIGSYRKRYVQPEPSGVYWLYRLNPSESKPLEENPDTLPWWYNSLLLKVATNHPYVDKFNAEENIIFHNYKWETITNYDFHICQFYEQYAYLRIDANDTGKAIEFIVEGEPTRYSIMVSMAVSPEYDRYIKESIQKARIHLNEDEIVAAFETDAVISNIDGGLGIFGAKNETYILEY